MTNSRLLLIDGFNLLSRGYFATSFNKEPEELPRNSEGRFTNAVNVFMTKLFQLIREQNPVSVHVSWDGKREEGLRHQEYDFYKAQRTDLPEPLIDQYHFLTELLENLQVPQSSAPGYEADDIMGTLAKRWGSERNGDVILYSNDRDLFQLIDERISQRVAKKKQEVVYDLPLFRDEFNLLPSQWVDVKALLGDASDNIPGCPGVGEKSAYPLIRHYHSLTGVYEALEKDELDPVFKRYRKKLTEGKELAQISYKLATIETNVPDINQMNLNGLSIHFSHSQAADLMRRHELRKPTAF